MPVTDRTRHDQTEQPAGARTVDVMEAAKRLGVTPDAVRAKLRRRTLEGYRDNQGRWRIVLPDTMDDMTRVQGDTTPTGANTTTGADALEAAALRATVAELRARVESLEDERDRLLLAVTIREPRLRDTIRRLASRWAAGLMRGKSEKEE